MKNRRKKRSYILDRIILVQVILLSVLVGVYLGKQDGKKSRQEVQTPTVTIDPTQQLSPTIAPTPTIVFEPTNAPGVIVITPEVTNESEPTPEVTKEDIPAVAQGRIGTKLITEGIPTLMYYMQTDSRWGSQIYGGTDTIAEYGCGPTSMAMVISSLTDNIVDPELMCQWAYEQEYWFPQQGSLHTLIPAAAQAYGLTCEGIENNEDAYAKVKQALTSQKMVVVLMGKGSFTQSGHFIVLRGITEEDMVYVADPMSEEHTNETWELSQIIGEAKSWAAANGPFWAIGK